MYAASGEGLQRPDLSTGDGVYKSTDAGRPGHIWMAFATAQQIGQIAIDPKDPNRVFVAVTGHPYGPNEERGLYRTLDGGKTFKHVLFANDRTGASEVQIDPSHPEIVFAGMWQRQEAPWENGSFIGAEGGLYSSTDGGDSLTKLTGNGLPDDILQVQLTISPSDSRRIYGAIASAFHGGYLIAPTTEACTGFTRRQTIRGPRNASAAATFPCPCRPQGPRYRVCGKHRDLEIDRCGQDLDRPARLARRRRLPECLDQSEQHENHCPGQRSRGHHLAKRRRNLDAVVQPGNGADVSCSPPTMRSLYRVCGGQQDSGSACVASRSDDGRITFHDWHPAGIEEYGYAAPDPLDPDIVYGGKVTRYDRRTGQIKTSSPKPRAAIAPCEPSRCSSLRSIRTSSTSPPTRFG